MLIYLDTKTDKHTKDTRVRKCGCAVEEATVADDKEKSAPGATAEETEPQVECGGGL